MDDLFATMLECSASASQFDANFGQSRNYIFVCCVARVYNVEQTTNHNSIFPSLLTKLWLYDACKLDDNFAALIYSVL